MAKLYLHIIADTMSKQTSSLIEVEDFYKLLNFFSANALVLIILPLMAFLLSLLYIHRQPTVYSSKSQILLKSEEVYDYQNQLTQGLGMGNSFASYDRIESQKRVILSSGLIRKTLRKLGVDVSYFIVGRIKKTEVYANLPFKVYPGLEGTAISNLAIAFRFIDKDFYELIFTHKGEELRKQYRFGEVIYDYGFNFRVDKAPFINEIALTSLIDLNYEFVINDLGILENKYKSSIAVESLDWTSIIELKCSDVIPARASAFLDSLSAVYIDYNLQNKLNINHKTQHFIDNQISDVIEILDQIEQDLETYRESKSILNLNKEENEYFNQLLEFESLKSNIKLNLNSIQDLRTYILNVGDDALLPPALYLVEGDEYLKKSINEFYSIQIERSEMMISAKEGNISVRQLDGKIDQLRFNLLTYLKNSEKAYEDKLKDVDKEIKRFESKLMGVPKDQRHLLNIERRLQVNEKLYLFLLEKRAETIISEGGIVSEVRVLEKAKTSGILSPNKSKIKTTFVLIGMALACAIAIINSLFFDKIKSVKELTERTDIPVFGGVPFLNKDEGSLPQSTAPKLPGF